jgi:tripartite-type tricarboxylate transporter receptor subunit TctC
MTAKLSPRRRRSLLAGAIAGIALSLSGLPGLAQEWPTKPIRLVLGYAPGGGADTTARLLAPSLERLLKQPIVIDYKSGAGGALAAAEVARAAPDGYTLGLVDNGVLTIIPAVRQPGYDPVASFTPISMVTLLPHVVVASPGLGANSSRDLIDLMRGQPGRLNFASGGPGSMSHLFAEMYLAQSKTSAVHIPFRGGSPAITAVVAGDVQFAFLTYAASSGFIKGGQVKALGVTSSSRLRSLPNVPTVAEQGLPGYEAVGWFALMGPAKMPPRIVAALDKALSETLTTPAVVSRLEEVGSLPATGQKVALGKRIADELAVWRKLITEQKITIEQ